MTGITKIARREPAADERPVMQLAATRLAARRVPEDNYQRRLCDSVARFGVMHPLMVRADGAGGRFVVVDGARRLAAALACGVSSLPCLLESAEIGAEELTARIKRPGASMFAQAEALRELIERCGLTQQEAATRLGVSQSTVANKLRLLKLGEGEREQIERLELSERHARAILSLPAELRGEALEKIEHGGLTVAATESLIEQLRAPRHRAAIRDVGIFYNSIDRALAILHNAGIAATLDREETEEGVTVIIHVSRERTSCFT